MSIKVHQGRSQFSKSPERPLSGPLAVRGILLWSANSKVIPRSNVEQWLCGEADKVLGGVELSTEPTHLRRPQQLAAETSARLFQTAIQYVNIAKHTLKWE